MRKFLISFILAGLTCSSFCSDEPIPEPHPEPPPNIDFMRVVTDSGNRYMEFGFNSRPHRTYELLISTNFNNWIVYGNVTADTEYTIARVPALNNNQFVCLRFSPLDIIFPF